MIRLISILSFVLFATTAHATSVIVPYAPGGQAAIVFGELNKSIPNLIAEYIPGAGGNLGMMRHVQRDKSLLLVGEAIYHNGTRQPNGYPTDILKVSKPVFVLRGAYYAIYTNTNVPFGSTNPIIFGASAPGSASHTATTELCRTLNCIIVPYMSSGRILPDLMRGEIHAMIAGLTMRQNLVDDKRISIHAILGPSIDGIPSYGSYEYASTIGLYAKGYTDSEIAELRKLIRLDPVALGFTTLDME